MRIMIVGHAKHGKDTVAHMIAAVMGLDFITSSQFCAEEVVKPYLAAKGIHYRSTVDCYNDRGNHRADWFNAIKEYNTPDLTRLTRAILSRYHMYCGIRNYDELRAIINAPDLNDIIRIWVDASMRQPMEPESSITVNPHQCQFFIRNNDGLEELWHNVKYLCDVQLKSQR